MRNFKLLSILLTILFFGCEKTFLFNAEPQEPDGINGNLIIPKNFDFSSTKPVAVDIAFDDSSIEGDVIIKLFKIYENEENLIFDGSFQGTNGFNKNFQLPNHIDQLKIEASFMGVTVFKEIQVSELQSVRFSIQDFQQDRLSSNKVRFNKVSDSDGDGVIDAVDVEVDNDDVAYYNYPQGQGTFYTSVFEDLWPCRGDFDFNDLVTLFTFREGLNANSEITELFINLKFAAMGANKDNAFAIRVMGEASMPTQVLSGVTLSSYYDSTNDATIFVFSNIKDAFGGFSSSHILNTVTSDVLPNNYLDLYVKISNIENGYDFFLIQNSDPTQELHTILGDVGVASALFAPSDRADTSLFGTCSDTSNTLITGSYDHTGQYYIDEVGMPWGICIPIQWVWPRESESILDVYSNLEDYIESDKLSSLDWYLDKPSNIANAAKVFRHF